jgi:hypothetical protein
MWPFKNKEVEVEEVEPQKPNMPDVLHGEDPWWIEKTRNGYAIYVYLFDDSEWSNICYCSDKVLGVNRDEYVRIVKEKYNSYQYGFINIENAKKALEEFRHLYDDFYMSRAVARRLMCYTSGGLQPYFQWYANEHNIKVPEDNDK